MYIGDIVHGLWMARDLRAGEAINLATGKVTTTLEMANLIIEMAGSKSKIKFVDYPPEHGNIKSQVGSFEKAKKEMGWMPIVELEEGVRETIGWLNGK